MSLQAERYDTGPLHRTGGMEALDFMLDEPSFLHEIPKQPVRGANVVPAYDVERDYTAADLANLANIEWYMEAFGLESEASIELDRNIKVAAAGSEIQEVLSRAEAEYQ